MGKIIETYTIDEVAESLKLHPYTVRRLCREKKIPAFKFGGQWRLNPEDLGEFIKTRTKR
jgi:excisionase family DNA binding protein